MHEQTSLGSSTSETIHKEQGMKYIQIVLQDWTKLYMIFYIQEGDYKKSDWDWYQTIR